MSCGAKQNRWVDDWAEDLRVEQERHDRAMERIRRQSILMKLILFLVVVGGLSLSILWGKFS